MKKDAFYMERKWKAAARMERRFGRRAGQRKSILRTRNEEGYPVSGQRVFLCIRNEDGDNVPLGLTSFPAGDWDCGSARTETPRSAALSPFSL